MKGAEPTEDGWLPVQDGRGQVWLFRSRRLISLCRTAGTSSGAVEVADQESSV